MSISDDRPSEPPLDEQQRPLDPDSPTIMDVETIPARRFEAEPAIQDRNWLLLKHYLGKPFLDELRRFAYRFTRNYADADDLVSEALLRIAEAFHTLQRPTLPIITAFLHTTIRNLAIDRARRKKLEAAYFPPEHGLDITGGADAYPSPDLEPQLSTYFDAEDRRLLAALAAIPKASRRVALLRFLWGYEVSDIAQKLGIAGRTVTTHMAKARKIFKQHFLREGDSHAAK